MAITEVTRRAIIAELILGKWAWEGRLGEPDFLARSYPLSDMPSYDHRFTSADRDIYQHRVLNYDWDDDWVFTDSRFQLSSGPDEVFLRFLAETVHPVVRPDKDQAATMVEAYNRHLREDGYELYPASEISGHTVYSARSLVDAAPALAQLRKVTVVDTSYLSQQMTRMETAILKDPELAIGTAKELVETVAKTILTERSVAFGRKDNLPKLVKDASKVLDLSRDSIPDTARGSDTIKRILSNLATIVDGVNDLRNLYGTGHGRVGGSSGIQVRHARLVVGAASTLATFLLETHAERDI